jgi:short-subunit dehydrogenase
MKPKLKPLAKQVIVITGASSGIGLTTARKAAEAGAKVMLVARNEAALRKAVGDIREAGGTADYAVADVGDERQVGQVADKTVKRFGGFDTWVNDAGVGIYAPLARTSTDEHERLFRTNYWGVVFGSLAAVKQLKKQRGGGALITVGSVASDIPSPMLGAYSASKHAVKGFTDTLRIELLKDKAPISVTLIKPSGIGTPFAEHAADHLQGEALIPPPVYAPELVADAILDAARSGRREITVGGAGRSQTMLTRLVPSLFDWLSTQFIPSMFDEHTPRTESDSLYTPAPGGVRSDKERSDIDHSRPFSVYTSAVLHPRLMLGVGLLAALAVAAALETRRA